MKQQNTIIIVLAFVLLSGLIFWQVSNLKLSERLKSTNDMQQLQSTLLATAIQISKDEKKYTAIRTNALQKKTHTENLISENFKEYRREFQWGYFNGLGKPIDSLNLNQVSEALKTSDLKVCTSCLVNISVLDDEGNNPNNSGFILNQTPAQMIEIKGMDQNSIRYLHLYVEPQKFSLINYLLPMLFLVGLTFLLVWLINLNNIQRKLIHQKNEFVNHLSHQFQTPLSSIKLSANLLSNEENANKNELVQIIQTESNRLENHIKTVLHWVKSDADRLKISKELLSITDVIEQSLKQMRPVFLTNKTRVNFVPPNEELTISADKNHLQLMLFNIWENAIKHNEQPIELRIECKHEADYILITSSDNGIGIKNVQSDQKFKGLGLAYVRRIMQEHQGSLMLKTNEYSGLSVQLKFPAYE